MAMAVWSESPMRVPRNALRVALGIAIVFVAVVAMGWLFLWTWILIGSLSWRGAIYGIVAFVLVAALTGYWLRRRR